MRHLHRPLTILAVVVAAALPLAACGDDNSASDASGSKAGSTKADSSSADEAGPGAAEDAPTPTLKKWCGYWSGDMGMENGAKTASAMADKMERYLQGLKELGVPKQMPPKVVDNLEATETRYVHVIDLMRGLGDMTPAEIQHPKTADAKAKISKVSKAMDQSNKADRPLYNWVDKNCS